MSLTRQTFYKCLPWNLNSHCLEPRFGLVHVLTINFVEISADTSCLTNFSSVVKDIIIKIKKKENEKNNTAIAH